ncbi:response regulator [Thermaurantimonas aggregans]|uniref:Response regulator n=1 Tax=Thermaurantimonas aggregans TaxID=2173829 RepID=A0A401XIG9_9FLAO|nr:response regulator [Thermaurantimonas aggregans]MCX8148758.1 response regulator [Thermaurantimonas aggregans]GCD76815.1 response regulator [Thermaurantimonas aggregans]
MNVLIIDDNQIDLLINQRVVKNLMPEAEIKSCISAIDALKYLEYLHINQEFEKLPDIILLDIRMPIMDGFEFLEKLNESPSLKLKIPKVLLVTSSIDPLDVQRSNEHPLVKGFIGKPLKMNALQEIINKLNF